MKVSVNKAKLNGLWARNCATIQQVLISKFAFGPEKKKKAPDRRLVSHSTELVRRVWLVNTLTSTPSIGCPIRARELQLIFANNGNEFNRSLQQTLLGKELVTNPTVHDKQKVRPQLHETQQSQG